MIAPLLLFFLLLAALAYFRSSLGTFSFILSLYLFTTTLTGLLPFWLWLPYLIVLLPMTIRHLRYPLISAPLFKLVKKRLPTLSTTEMIAIEAGSSWWEAELFRGAPDWKKLHNYPAPRLTLEEQAFIDGPLEQLCAISCDWEINQIHHQLPEPIWAHLRQHRFWAMNISKEYGGHQFSAYAISCVLQKLASISTALAASVAAPNSLGPAALLQRYGTPEQKNRYLTAIAKGEEIPCFAISSLEAGSDINAITDEGIVCTGEWQGKTTLGIKLSWSKHYITLAPAATIMGLAFKLKDPEKLINDNPNIGITCALIPTSLPGIDIGRRHNPLNIALTTGPTKANDLFIPLNFIIGEEKMAGQGWKMLMECLVQTRGVILPSCCCGTVKMAALTSGAYSRIRHQFDQAIDYHQGVEEILARLGSSAYLMDAAVRLTVTGVDMGESPGIIAAIVKYHLTQMMQQRITDAMAIHGGKGICLGPKNYLGLFYQGAPIATIVEGANIITRNLIIYGQGAIRCHPYLLNELRATQLKEPAAALELFDRTIISHFGYALSNLTRAIFIGFTGGYLIFSHRINYRLRYYQLLSRYSTYLALLSDITIAILGSKIKTMERTSARLGDILSYLYLSSAVLKRFEDEGHQTQDQPLMHGAMRHCITQIEDAMDDLLTNYPSPFLGRLLRIMLFPLGRPHKRERDKLDQEIAKIMITPCNARERVGYDCYLNTQTQHPTGQLEKALKQFVNIEPILSRLSQQQKVTIAFRRLDTIAREGLKAGNLTQAEAQQLIDAEQMRLNIIGVDDFPAS